MHKDLTQHPLVTLHEMFTLLGIHDKFSTIQTLINDLEDLIPKNVEGYDTLSYGYFKKKDYLKAIEYGEKALDEAFDVKTKNLVKANLGKCYQNANFPHKAASCFKAVYEADKDVNALLDYATALYSMGKKDEAGEILFQLEADNRLTDDNRKAARFNTGAHLIRKGQFKEGMKALSIGREMRIWGSYTHQYPIPEWDGKAYPGKSVLIVGEGGIGDEIINARFVKHIRDMKMIPSWVSAHNLTSIFKRLPFHKTFDYKLYTNQIANIRDFDFWTPAMNLPVTLGVDVQDLWYGPYLSVDKNYETKWKEKIKNTGKIKVGVRWMGNPLYEHDLHRSIPIDQVYKILNDSGKFDIYSLQRDAGADQTKNFINMIDLQNDLESFEDTLAAINEMDFIVTSCTSIAHAAGALDKKTYVMNPLMTYYVWGEEKEHSSWYSDKVTLLQQTKPRSWQDSLNKLQTIINEV